MCWPTDHLAPSACRWRTALLSALGRRDSRLWASIEDEQTFDILGDTADALECETRILVTLSYTIDGLANRLPRTERVSLAHGPSERPRKARTAIWAAVEDKQSFESSGEYAHV